MSEKRELEQLAATICITKDYKLLMHILEESEYYRNENAKLLDLVTSQDKEKRAYYEWNTRLHIEVWELRALLVKLDPKPPTITEPPKDTDENK